MLNFRSRALCDTTRALIQYSGSCVLEDPHLLDHALLTRALGKHRDAEDLQSLPSYKKVSPYRAHGAANR